METTAIPLLLKNGLFHIKLSLTNLGNWLKVKQITIIPNFSREAVDKGKCVRLG